MLDKQSSKIYRKLVCANNQIEAFKIVDRLKPHEAKRVLIHYVLNQKAREHLNHSK